MDGTTAIRHYFLRLGCSKAAADVYVQLHLNGVQSISQLSRMTGIERTRVYRVLNELESIHMVETEVRYKRKLIRAAPITNLRILIAKGDEKSPIFRQSSRQSNSMQAAAQQAHTELGCNFIQAITASSKCYGMNYGRTVK